VRNTYKVLVGIPEGKLPLGELGVDWRIMLRKTGYESVDWIYLAQDRAPLSSSVNGNEHSDSITAGCNFLIH